GSLQCGRLSSGLEPLLRAACWPIRTPSSQRRINQNEFGTHPSLIEPLADHRRFRRAIPFPGCLSCKQRRFEADQSCIFHAHCASDDPYILQRSCCERGPLRIIPSATEEVG